MIWPHERAFVHRVIGFWALSSLALALAGRTPGLSASALALGLLFAVVSTWVVFRYTSWLVRIDGQFRDVYPSKIRITTLVAYYGSCVLAGAVLLVGAAAPTDPSKTPLQNASPLLCVPALLASAAGALRGGRDSGILD